MPAKSGQIFGPKNPSALDLFECASKILENFAFLHSRYLGAPSEGPSHTLDVERLVQIRGPVELTLVIRANSSFAQMLSAAARGESGGDDVEANDAFQEFCNLFAGHFLTRVWGKEAPSFGSFLPRPSRPAQWPKLEADAACALLVERFPLEVRLWCQMPS